MKIIPIMDYKVKSNFSKVAFCGPTDENGDAFIPWWSDRNTSNNIGGLDAIDTRAKLPDSSGVARQLMNDTLAIASEISKEIKK